MLNSDGTKIQQVNFYLPFDDKNIFVDFDLAFVAYTYNLECDTTDLDIKTKRYVESCLDEKINNLRNIFDDNYSTLLERMTQHFTSVVAQYLGKTFEYDKSMNIVFDSLKLPKEYDCAKIFARADLHDIYYMIKAVNKQNKYFLKEFVYSQLQPVGTWYPLYSQNLDAWGKDLTKLTPAQIGLLFEGVLTFKLGKNWQEKVLLESNVFYDSGRIACEIESMPEFAKFFEVLNALESTA